MRTRFYHEYTIWCWPEYNTQSNRGGLCGPEYSQGESFGGSICALNETIWKHLTRGYFPTDLERIILEYFTVFPNLKEEYINRIKDRLTGKLYSYVYYQGITAAENRYRIDKTNMTIMQMIDEVSPYLFTGLAKIAYAGDDYIQSTLIYTHLVLGLKEDEYICRVASTPHEFASIMVSNSLGKEGRRSARGGLESI